MAGLLTLFSWLMILGNPTPFVIGDQLWVAAFAFLTICWAALVAVLTQIAKRDKSTK